MSTRANWKKHGQAFSPLEGVLVTVTCKRELIARTAWKTDAKNIQLVDLLRTVAHNKTQTTKKNGRPKSSGNV